jgi:peptidyl-dipeptidase A
MCIRKNQEDLTTIHHELGHDYYFNNYYTLPVLYQQGANDGFHEAIGDTIALSVTPEYLKTKGLLTKVEKNDMATINHQMAVALDKIAFLPFGLLIDKWRWDVFAGRVEAKDYNEHWWDLKLKYQGVVPPVGRTEADLFDPGAKAHIATNTPYMRYFLAEVLQFQFHRALCKQAGFNGPLHECSIYGNKDAGEALKKMLAMGATAVAGRTVRADRPTRDGCERDPRVLWAAPDVAGGAEQGRAVRLVSSIATRRHAVSLSNQRV